MATEVTLRINRSNSASSGVASGTVNIESSVTQNNIIANTTQPPDPIATSQNTTVINILADAKIVGAQGPPGPAGTPGEIRVTNKIPTPSPNGIITEFTVPDTYIAGSLTVLLNGLNEIYFDETGSDTFEFDTAPHTGDIIRLAYRTA